MRHPGVPDQARGTYAGLASAPIIEYLTTLGITTLELLPAHHFVSQRFLVDQGLSNYWGYNTLGYFAPHAGYASGGRQGEQVTEFKNMVKTLHRHGIEVVLDVVYNHTAEGNQLGPTLSFKGIDNTSYYRLVPDQPRYYMDYTGTGNTLNMRQPRVLQLVMDSLRYWVQEMHVDGFRFDLASTLARELHEVDRLGAFLDIIQQDPIISQVKLIAEPWDLGEGGYQVGNFPIGWAEWNGKYRDTVRDYWRGVESQLGEFATRLTGSADLYATSGRKPYASVNFVTAHDGFTLADLVSYEQKHNDANSEENRDGTDDNRSWNCGVEGPTNDANVNALRERQKRNFLATLLLSQGMPMLLGGDEIGRTQGGNNNAWCQDNETTWYDWENADEDLLRFTQELISLRKNHRVFQRRYWFYGDRSLSGDGDIGWFKPDGRAMSEQDWQEAFPKSLAVFLNGEKISGPGPHGEPIADDSFYLLFNASADDVVFTAPPLDSVSEWKTVIHTENTTRTEKDEITPGDRITMIGHSLAVLISRAPSTGTR